MQIQVDSVGVFPQFPGALEIGTQGPRATGDLLFSRCKATLMQTQPRVPLHALALYTIVEEACCVLRSSNGSCAKVSEAFTKSGRLVA